mmetsp:Transcript_40246/g.93599  ORF Transcript_40246/g.93599 Transcript_40246/m.93599 type:complete len:564 (-) Transcript_40246:141-1832(-)
MAEDPLLGEKTSLKEDGLAAPSSFVKRLITLPLLLVGVVVLGPVLVCVLLLVVLVATLSDMLGLVYWCLRCKAGGPSQGGDELQEDYMQLFKTEDKELTSVLLTTLEGELPKELHGTYYLTGPGRVFALGELINPFDGHAFVRAFQMSNGEVRLTTRFVRTAAFEKEQSSSYRIFRGFGSTLPGRMPRLRNLLFARMGMNNPNICVQKWGEKLFCLGESGSGPYVLDPTTLATRSEAFSFGDNVGSSEKTLAHTRLDSKGHLVVVARAFKDGRLRFLQVDQAGEVLSQQAWTMPRSCYVHDFAVTDDYFVVLESPFAPQPLEVAKALLGWRPMTAALWTDTTKSSHLVLVPRRGPGAPREFNLGEHFFCFHHANVWQEAGKLHLHSVVMRNFQFGDAFGYTPGGSALNARWSVGKGSGLLSTVVDLSAGTVVSKSMQPALKGDFPEVHPAFEGKRSRWCYLASSTTADLFTPPNCLKQVDLQEGVSAQSWQAPPRVFLGEPKVVAAEGATHEEQGWVIVLAYNCKALQTELMVFHAGNVGAGPLCRMSCGVMLPYGFHGSWSG